MDRVGEFDQNPDMYVLTFSLLISEPSHPDQSPQLLSGCPRRRPRGRHLPTSCRRLAGRDLQGEFVRPYEQHAGTLTVPVLFEGDVYPA